MKPLKADLSKPRSSQPVPHRRLHDGFSLLELLVVLALIGILAAAALPRFESFRAAAYDTRAQQDLRNLAAAEELHRAVNQEYATNAEELDGFRTSEGVSVSVESVDDSGFRASASHPQGSRRYTWDSNGDPPLSSSKLTQPGS